MSQHCPGRLPRSQGFDLRWALILGPLHPFSGEIVVPTAHRPWQWQASSPVARSIAVTEAPPCFRPFGGSLGLRIQKEAGGLLRWVRPSSQPGCSSPMPPRGQPRGQPLPRCFPRILPAPSHRSCSLPGPLRVLSPPGLGSECPLAMAAVHIPSWHLELRDKNVTTT